MAIFDSEKRPRGLRVPSLTAMKNGSAASRSQFSFTSKKSNESKAPNEQPVRASVRTAASAPSPRPPPPQKDLPPTPKETLSPPPRMSSKKVPPRRELAANAHTTAQPNQQPPAPTAPLAPLAPPAPPAAPQPVRPAVSPIVTAPPPQPEVPLQSPQSPKTVPPVTLSPPPGPAAAVEGDSAAPLEDFIPTPEPPATPLEPLEPISRDEQPSPFTPLDLDSVVAAPLDKIHFACYQEHCSMPVAQNVWCPLPCMSCLKLDREIRHRCVFCCLRICGDCYQLLQKCENRSLAELMNKLR
ncbi:uncharacterized protein N7459_006780 [Penicillium hispanicum]|uniref:uncharacterized protein n=1 Tax=Penicillium hispanicum TaxID=1080232 RepID=UPI002540E1CA|nr:uncharacterized protein N7459_006780 [Penicillium hispanicum]KAJ5577816.1 hypothetical protein N7459_006780 [Penicillium hispanicum]